ncbi:MAG: glycosyltransferase, partial [Solirubrobacteraceae bacterium]|nr:glycosyltransferase [Solirubrobacteraceae bacterium]
TAIIASAALGGRGKVVTIENCGVAAARNLGETESSELADFILFLDADDVLAPEMAQTLVAKLAGNDGARAAFCGLRFIDENSRPVFPTKYDSRRTSRRGRISYIDDDEALTPFLSILEHACMYPSNTVLRRSVLEATGGFDVDLGQPFEDTDLYLRVALRGQVLFVDEKLAQYRRHATQSTASDERFSAQQHRFFAKWRDLSRLPAADRRVVRAAWRRHDGVFTRTLGLRAARNAARRGNWRMTIRFTGGVVRALLRVALSFPVGALDRLRSAPPRPDS